MARALVLKEAGNPSSLSLSDIPEQTPGEGEVRIRFTSIGLNRADLLYCQNRYFNKAKDGSRLGFEGAGIVISAGKNSLYKAGDRVAICPMSFDASKQGCLADEGIYQDAQLIPSPRTIGDEQSGAIWMAFLTAWGGMVEAGGLAAGQYVVITAASSSVGIAAIQLAKARDAIPIATTTTNDKLTTLKQLGATHALLQPREAEQWNGYTEQIRQITAGAGSDLVFDAVAGPASHAMIKASRRGGTIVIQGMLDRRPMDIHAGVMMKRLLTLKGYTLDATLDDPISKTRAINTLHKYFESRQLSPTIAKTFSLEQYNEAFSYLSSNQQIGKVVIVPD